MAKSMHPAGRCAKNAPKHGPSISREWSATCRAAQGGPSVLNVNITEIVQGALLKIIPDVVPGVVRLQYRRSLDVPRLLLFTPLGVEGGEQYNRASGWYAVGTVIVPGLLPTTVRL